MWYASLCAWIKSMPIMLMLSSLMKLTGCVNFFPLIYRSTSNMPSLVSWGCDTALCVWNFSWFVFTKGHFKPLSIHTGDSSISIKIPWMVLFPALTNWLGLILSTLKGDMISKNSLQVAMDTKQKLKINFGMALGVWMWGIIKLIRDNPTVTVFIHHINFWLLSTSLFFFAVCFFGF